jgi:hypothetical protein
MALLATFCATRSQIPRAATTAVVFLYWRSASPEEGFLAPWQATQYFCMSGAISRAKLSAGVAVARAVVAAAFGRAAGAPVRAGGAAAKRTPASGRESESRGSVRFTTAFVRALDRRVPAGRQHAGRPILDRPDDLRRASKVFVSLFSAAG